MFGTSKVGLLSEILVIIGMALFVLFANILLVNLLIADFRFVTFVTFISCYPGNSSYANMILKASKTW